jgi:hypothetical protein
MKGIRLLSSLLKAVFKVKLGDSANVDAFSRLRTAEPFGIFDNKNISNRNRNQWVEIIDGAILTYNTLVGGPFQAGEEIRGTLPAGSIPIAIINTDNGVDTMNISVDHNDFQVGDTITGQTSGATATIVSAGTGSDIQHNYNRSSVILTVGTRANDRAIRSTHRYNAYVPGKSQYILQTFIFGAPVANVVRRVGYYDNLNGLYLEQTESDIAFVIRTATSGAVSDARRIPQNLWNLDTLDGSGPSGIALDLTKSQILFIDFQWLGVGRVRFGFDIDGQGVFVHEALNANILDVVYMKTPTLPLRHEILNTGVTLGQNYTEEICCSVSSEGGYALPGLEFDVDSDTTARTVGSVVFTPVFAIRLKNEFPTGEPNRRVAKFLSAALLAETNAALVRLLHVHEPVDVVATWSSAGEGSAVEFSTDISSYTGRPAHRVDSIHVAPTQGGKANPGVLTGEFINLHSFIAQSFNSDNSQMFIIEAKALTGNADIYSGISYIEFE